MVFLKKVFVSIGFFVFIVSGVVAQDEVGLGAFDNMGSDNLEPEVKNEVDNSIEKEPEPVNFGNMLSSLGDSQVDVLRAEISKQQVLVNELKALLDSVAKLENVPPDIIKILLMTEIGSEEKLEKILFHKKKQIKPTRKRVSPGLKDSHLVLVSIGEDGKGNTIVLRAGKTELSLGIGDKGKFLGREYELLRVGELGGALVAELRATGSTKVVKLSYRK